MEWIGGLEIDMTISTGELCLLAAELAEEHGDCASDYAWRTYRSLATDGVCDGAELWFSLSVLLEDINTFGIDPEQPLSIH